MSVFLLPKNAAACLPLLNTKQRLTDALLNCSQSSDLTGSERYQQAGRQRSPARQDVTYKKPNSLRKTGLWLLLIKSLATAGTV